MQERKYSPTIDWERFDQPLFDRLMEALIPRAHPESSAHFVTDSGGDGGRDLVLTEDGRTTIYQFKFFVGAVTKQPSSRLRQIENSFISALQHDPDAWVLVVPGKLNDPMKKFVHELPGRKSVTQSEYDASRVAISFLDGPALDAMLIDHPEVIALLQAEYPEQKEMWRQLSDMNRGPISGPGELEPALEALNARVQTGSLNWGADVQYRNGRSFLSPRPLHPRAHEVEPISRRLKISFPQAERGQELAARFRELMAYGGPTPVEVPREYVTLEEYTGPELFRGLDDFDAFLFEAERVDVEAGPYLILISHEESGDTQIEAAISSVTRGSSGGTITFDCGPGLEIVLRQDFETAAQARVTYTLDPEELKVHELAQASKHALALARAEVFTLVSSEGTESAMARAHEEDADRLDDLRLMHEIASDLAVIQRLLRQPLKMLEQFDVIEAVMLRSLRLALEGKVAAIPAKEMHFNLRDGVTRSDLPLGGPEDPGMAIFWSRDASEKYEIGPNSVAVPVLYFTHPNCYIKSFDEDGRKATVRTHGDEAFVIYAPEKLTDTSGFTTPWALPGVDEPRSPKVNFGS